MASTDETRSIAEMVARQGYDLPDERAARLADGALDLAAFARGLEDGLPFTADLFGLATLLGQWRAKR